MFESVSLLSVFLTDHVIKQLCTHIQRVIGSLSSGCSRDSQRERAFTLQPRILGTGAALWHRAAGVAQALVAMDTP